MLIELTHTPATGAPMLCYKCGTGNVEIIRDDYAVCESCEDDFQAAMQAEFPWGQCYTCGVGGSESLPAWKPGPHHSEGGCGLWADLGDYYDD